ncbi:MAG: SpoIID/LytB domain-containing protein [Bacteroides sp.]|nr:SpoIID/LytB domain-containing protein [Bacteroides sp.]MCM1413657.1 SpoIID/LytB domain-containing protein [Bacteroides sp.]MCM1471836.1 SpoIID/LytB domain-containing protein [Bacteroides sp.]
MSTIKAGIVRASRISLNFNEPFSLNDGDSRVVGDVSLSVIDGKVAVDGAKYDSVKFTPTDPKCLTTVRNVTIGIDFHWQQTENQKFVGAMHAVIDGDAVWLINEVDIEDYLLSVISSEMNANAPEEFLKAHAVISRSWALAQIEPGDYIAGDDGQVDTGLERIKWYDHSSHTLFDVCSDDHCQRYQGVTKASTDMARKAVVTTRGEVLKYNGRLCDARFSKCCGGITERFSTCWQPVDFGYLPAEFDDAEASAADCSDEDAARRWILAPDRRAFCSNPSAAVLRTVLNSYDRQTPHLYRWTQEYSADELADIVRERTGIDVGRLLSIKPLHRGPSGRIDRLEIVGTCHRMVIGKELEIRRSLSRSHLYSSAFIVESGACDETGVPTSWRFIGAGWGHGVGLCQIGAAVMATQGYDYRQILSHYFPGTEIDKLWD